MFGCGCASVPIACPPPPLPICTLPSPCPPPTICLPPSCPPPPICPPPLPPPLPVCPPPLPPPPPPACPPPIFPPMCPSYQPTPYSIAPPQNDCCCRCDNPCQYRARTRMHGARIFSSNNTELDEDPTCNNIKLRTIMQEV
ncbi:unnamed protein product [Toxocara canis]|uniref:Uncharacterized protein n=1 Tax=Toxocara canis TaxID=6265 RepID=A0A183U7X1_TOXCA|nr:unnamed protein product [Toxocara canis]